MSSGYLVRATLTALGLAVVFSRSTHAVRVIEALGASYLVSAGILHLRRRRDPPPPAESLVEPFRRGVPHEPPESERCTLVACVRRVVDALKMAVAEFRPRRRRTAEPASTGVVSVKSGMPTDRAIVAPFPHDRVG